MVAQKSDSQCCKPEVTSPYVADENMTNAGKISYLVVDSAVTTSTGPARDIYISYYNDGTDDYMTTSMDHLTEITLLSDMASYAGTAKSPTSDIRRYKTSKMPCVLKVSCEMRSVREIT